MRFFAKPGLLVATALILLAITPARGTPSCPLIPSLLPDGVPEYLCSQPTEQQEAFAHMAWQTFKMLVWPASATARGEADANRDVTDMQGSRVFETYKAGWESFPAGTVRPLPWSLYPSEATACQGYVPPRTAPLPADALVLASLNKLGIVTQPGFPPDNDSERRRLMAQNGSLVRYLSAFNKKAFELIQLYNDGNPVQPVEAGAITIKSAWIEMKGSIPDQSKFHVRSAWVQNPSDGTCSEATVGLVGLHIVFKIKAKTPEEENTRPGRQWVWASFEHVDNVPLQVNPPVSHDPPRQGFTFNDGSGRQMEGDPPLEPQTPYNVERVYDIAQPVRTVNGAWQDEFRKKPSVWANYELVVVQWATQVTQDDRLPNPSPPCFVGQLDTNMANSTMETTLQSKLVCGPNSNLSTTCIGCHAMTPDLRKHELIWAIGLYAKPPP